MNDMNKIFVIIYSWTFQCLRTSRRRTFSSGTVEKKIREREKEEEEEEERVSFSPPPIAFVRSVDLEEKEEMKAIHTSSKRDIFIDGERKASSMWRRRHACQSASQSVSQSFSSFSLFEHTSNIGKIG